VAFAKQRVLVTGGTGGIGAATCRQLRNAGAHVAVGTRSTTRFRELAGDIGDTNLYPAVGELDSQQACARLVAETTQTLGGLDILINAAGLFEEIPIEQIDQQHWDANMALNVGSVFFCSQAALPALREAGGNIVNIASDAGMVGYPLGAAYSAAKGAVVNLTRTLALECAPDVRINCVCPGNVDTAMIQRAAQAAEQADDYLATARNRSPLGRMARPDEIAAAIAYLASATASFTNGAILPVDGGGVCG
jgi:meso-butanediol dehydrogenase/(S,S)-butanediol dehydrogenase/diacetyl reductase